MATWQPCPSPESLSLWPFDRQPQFSQLVEANGAILDMVKGCDHNGGGRTRLRELSALAARVTDAVGIGMILVHSATECGDQIIKLFLAAHNKPLQ